MATGFGHNSHHQTISQKLKKRSVHIVQNRQFICDPIYININNFNIITSLEMSYLQHDVSRLWYGGCEYMWNTYKFVTLVKIALGAQLVTSAAVHRVEIMVLIYEGCSKKRQNFLNSAPTSIESALRLLNAPSVRFWQQTAICPFALWELVVELHTLNWALAQAVRRRPKLFK
jgi:hypothetical protein